MTLPLIGLVGRKRSGKDTAAERLKGYHKIAYADPLRDLLDSADPIVGHELDGPYKVRAIHWSEAMDALGYELAKERYPEVRRIQQTTGTQGVRETLGVAYGLEELLGASPWVAMAELRIAKALSHRSIEPHTDKLVHHWRVLHAFTDVRFPNEAALIKRYGGALIRVTRPGLPTDDLHPSETALDAYPVDYELVNDGTIADLHAKVDELLASLA